MAGKRHISAPAGRRTHRRGQISCLLAAGLLALLLAGHALRAVPALASPQQPQPPRRPAIAALLSDDVLAYHRVLEHFRAVVNLPVTSFNLEGKIDRAPEVMRRVMAANPACILALGAKAAVAAKTWTRESGRPPVLFALVLNWRRYGLDKAPNIAGIEAEVAYATQLANVKMFLPAIRRLGVIYNEEQSGALVAGARKAASLLGLELVEATIDRPEEFASAFRTMADRVDAFWMMADPVAYTLDNIAWLKERCIRYRMVCIGQSANIARAGLLVAVDADLVAVGAQAADLARAMVLQGKTPREIGIMPPLGTRIIVNLRTARAIDLAIEPEALDLATLVIGR